MSPADHSIRHRDSALVLVSPKLNCPVSGGDKRMIDPNARDEYDFPEKDLPKHAFYDVYDVVDSPLAAEPTLDD